MDRKSMAMMEGYLKDQFKVDDDLIIATNDGSFIYGKFVAAEDGFLIVKRDLPINLGITNCLLSLLQIVMVAKEPKELE